MVNRIALSIFLVGVISLTTGSAMIYRPLGFIVSGIICMFAGYVSIRGKKVKE